MRRRWAATDITKLAAQTERSNMAVRDKNKEMIIEPKTIWIGEGSAPVSLVMFGDYQSEPCVKAHKVVKKLLEAYKGKVKFNYRHFPLTQVHQHAQKAAEAAVAAVQENKFWEMHDLLYQHHKRLGTVSLKEYAREAGVTDKNFLPKLVDSAYGWTVRADLLAGLAIGVRDVPAFFINDEPYTGKPTFDGLSAAIDDALKASKRKKVA
jgi:protein-disulfide isomerase